ncbi:site-specific integrase, partial [Mycobacterium kansasii]
GGTLAAQAGATTKELMDRLGHATPVMALRYQHTAAGRDAAIADKLGELAGR